MKLPPGMHRAASDDTLAAIRGKALTEARLTLHRAGFTAPTLKEQLAQVIAAARRPHQPLKPN